LFGRLFSMKAEMARYRLDMPRSRLYLESSIKIALASSNTGLLGRVYYQLGLLEYMAENTSKASKLFFKSLDCINAIEYPTLTAIVYIYLARLQEQTLNYTLSIEYFKHSIDILESIDNVYYLGWAYNALGMSEAVQGNIYKAKGLRGELPRPKDLYSDISVSSSSSYSLSFCSPL